MDEPVKRQIIVLMRQNGPLVKAEKEKVANTVHYHDPYLLHPSQTLSSIRGPPIPSLRLLGKGIRSNFRTASPFQAAFIRVRDWEDSTPVMVHCMEAFPLVLLRRDGGGVLDGISLQPLPPACQLELRA